jgi:hypothetical protein
MVTKKFGFVSLGQMINEYKFPSSDNYIDTFQFVIKSVKLFEILANRKSLSYGISHMDNFIIATNKMINFNKLTTKSLRVRFFNGCCPPLPRPEFNSIKKIVHPKEREIVYFNLHNVILSNSKLFDMKVVSTPLCDKCMIVQTSDHIFNQCHNAIIASCAFNSFAAQYANNLFLKINIESLIKRILYLNRNSNVNSEMFNTAIVNRINDFNAINLSKSKRKELAIVNKITLL